MRKIYEKIYENTISIELRPVAGSTHSVISIHGGGPSGKERVSYILDLLEERGISSIAFDFPGHGESDGELKKCSLFNRVNITKEVIRKYCNEEKLSIIGTSMGGHVAAELVGCMKVDALVLFCPAAYADEAFKVPFGYGFTEIIRKEGSYRDSSVFSKMKKFQGKFLLIYGDSDDIIPEEVLDYYWSSAENSKYKRRVILENTPHVIHKWVEKHPKIKRKVLDEILEFWG